MHPDDLASRLRLAATGQRGRTAACPDEHQIAAYVDGALGPEDCEELELHVADCEACVALVATLSRQRGVDAVEPVPQLVLARAQRLGQTSATRWKRYVPHLTAAAIVLVSIPVLMHLAQVQGPGTEPPTTADEQATRSLPAGPFALQVLSPRAGMTVDADHLLFRWTEVPGSRFYDVRIVTESGDLVMEKRIAGTEWRAPVELDLHPGVEYFVHIDAYPADAKTVSSDHIPFTVAEKP